MKTSSFILYCLLLFVLSSCSRLTAETYYVSNSGNDSNNGKSPSNAWKTISKVNSISFVPGDSILFQRGDLWRTGIEGALRISSSGTPESYICYGAYGSGDKPRILGSVVASDWVKVTGDIWQSNSTINNNPRTWGYGAEIFFEETGAIYTWGEYSDYQSDYTNLTDEYDWTWNDETIYIYSSSNPNVKYLSVEAPQTERLIYLMDKEYIEINNLEIAYSTNIGIYDQYDPTQISGLRVTNCHIHHIGYKNSGQAFGLSVRHSNMYIAHNEIHDCGRRGISINLYDNTPPSIHMDSVIIENNHLYSGWHTTGVDCINSGDHVISNLIIRNNIFEDDPDLYLGERYYNVNSNQIFIACDPRDASAIKEVKIYNNIFLHGKGKMITVDGVDGCDIHYNTLYGMNQSMVDPQNMIHISALHKPNTDVNMSNNIIYNNAPYPDVNYSHNLFIRYDTYDGMNTIDHNLYWAENPEQPMLNVWQQGVIDNIYHRNDIEKWRADHNFDINSPPPQDPYFRNTDNNDFRLTDSSAAIGAGKSIPWIDKDFYGKPINEPPDIGAIQYDTISQREESTSNFILSPNPAIDNYFDIKINENIAVNRFFIRLFTSQGELVFQTSEFQGNTARIQLQQEFRGVYLVEVVVDQTKSLNSMILLMI